MNKEKFVAEVARIKEFYHGYIHALLDMEKQADELLKVESREIVLQLIDECFTDIEMETVRAYEME